MVDTGPVPKTGKGADPKTAFVQVSPAAVLSNLDWGDDLAEVVVCYAGLAGTTDGGWTVRCWSYAHGLSGFYEIRAKLDSVVFASRITAVVLSLSRVLSARIPSSFYCSGLRANSSRLSRTRASSSGTCDLRCSCKPSPGVSLLTNVWAAAALFLQVPGL